MDFLDIHTHNKTQKEGVFSICNEYPNSLDTTIPFSVGIHPWFLQEQMLSSELQLLEKGLTHSNCVALGECGLDKVISIDFDFQIDTFKKQIALSEKYEKPVIIHCVKAYQEIIAIKKEVKPKQNWIIHGFHKNKEVAESLLKNDIYLSFGAKIISDQKLQGVFVSMPLEHIFLETDDAEISIQEVYKQAVLLRKKSVTELQQILKQNFTNIFKK